MSRTAAPSVRTRLSLLAIATLAGAASAQVNYTTVLLTGQQAPAMAAGITVDFNGLYQHITAQGRVAAGATLLGGGLPAYTYASFVGMPGNLVPMTKETDAAPGFPGLTIESIGSPMICDDGSAIWGATLAGSGVTTANDRVWYGGPAMSPLVLARKGNQAVGLPAGVVYAGMYYPCANNGHSIMSAWLAGPGLTPNFNDLAMWTGYNGSLSLIARSSMQAPGCPIGVSFQNFTVLYSINSSGNAAFFAVLQGPGVTGSNNGAEVMGQPGALNLVARTGNQAPGFAAGIVYEGPMSPLRINNANAMTFSSHVVGGSVTETDNSVLWSGTLGAMTAAAREGTQAPGCPVGVKYGEMTFYPLIGAGNRLAFSAALTGLGVTTANDIAWWIGTPGAFTLLAREGGQAPGCPAGVVYGDLEDMGASMNASGRVFFIAPLTGAGVTTANDSAVFATGPNGGVRLIARKGDALAVAPGDSRVVTTLNAVYHSGGQDGNGASLSDGGQAIFRVGFADSASATIIADINTCWANCDNSAIAPVLNVADFGCFLNKFAAGDSYANCDGSLVAPVLNVADFGCFLNKFAAGCP